jgi:hypothetical protein
MLTKGFGAGALPYDEAMLQASAAEHVQALALVGDRVSVHTEVVPSITVIPAAGVNAYSGFGSDRQSRQARAWLMRRLAGHERRHGG